MKPVIYIEISLLALGLLAPTSGQAECNGPSWTPDSRYEIRGDGGEVYDLETQSTWKRCLEGQRWDGSTCVGEPLKMSWYKMKDTWPATGDGWRVPNVDELATLRSGTEFANKLLLESGKTGCWDRSINQNVFDSAIPSWSSSVYAGASSKVWLVGFYNGQVAFNYRYYGFAVRLVRSGQYLGPLAQVGAAEAPYTFKPGSGYREMFANCSNQNDDDCFEQFIKEFSAKDPDKLIPQARKKLAEIPVSEERAAFSKASSSSDWDDFINKYSNKDLAKLIPQARQKLAAAKQREREANERYERESREREARRQQAVRSIRYSVRTKLPLTNAREFSITNIILDCSADGLGRPSDNAFVIMTYYYGDRYSSPHSTFSAEVWSKHYGTYNSFEEAAMATCKGAFGIY